MSGLAGWLALLLTGCGPPAQSTRCDETLQVEDGRGICVRVAEGGAALRQGLQGAAPLGEGEGMLLRYPAVSRACITMKGMEQPLDAWFLGDDGRVLQAACSLRPGDETPVCQSGTQQVLEMAPHTECDAHAGWVVERAPGLVGPVPPSTLEGDRCDGTIPPAGPIDGRLHLVVHRSSLVSEATVRELLERAQAYYAPYGLWLTVDAVVELPPAQFVVEGVHGGKTSDALLVGTRLELLERLKSEGLPETTTNEAERAQVDAVVQDLVLGPYRSLVSRLAADVGVSNERGPNGRVHVVFLRHIAQPGSLGAGLFQELRGLTVSPWLAESDGDRALAEALGLPKRFAPVAVVGTEPVSQLGPTAVDATLAHELGHALGLPHVPGKDELMQEGVHPCVPALRPEQAEALRGHERL